MSYAGCIQSHADKGTISQKKADQLQKQYDDLVAKYSETMGDLPSAILAADKLIGLKAKKIVDEKFSTLRAIKEMKKNRERVLSDYEKSIAGYKKLSKAQKALLGGQKPTISQKIRDLYDTVASSQEFTIRMLYQEVEELIRQRGMFHQTKEFKETMKQAVMDLLGKPSGDATAREFSKALKNAFDLGNKLYNLHGGMMGRIANYFPQVHSASRFTNLVKEFGDVSDPAAINQAFKSWYDFIAPRLDTDRMINEKTGLPFSESDLKDIMREDFENIMTDGGYELSKFAMKDGVQPPRGGDLNKRRDKARFYHFKDADSFLEYNDKFGIGNDNLYDAAIGHLGVLGRDIGTMNKLGPKPDSTHANLMLLANAEKNQPKKFTDDIYKSITGKLSATGSEPTWYRVYGAYRNQLRGAYLGSAFISALGDPYFGRLAAKRFGLPGFSTLNQLPKIFSEGGINAESFKFAQTQTDLIAGSSINRFDEDVDIGARALSGYEKFAHYSSEFIHRAGGLNRWTNFNELSGTLAVMHQAFQESSKSFDKLNPNYRGMMEMYGISAKEWAIISSTEPHVVGRREAKFLSPHKIMERTDIPYEDRVSAALAYGSYIQGFRDMVVNKPTARVRGVQTGGQQAGTLYRATMQSATMFKGFGLTVMLNHLTPLYTQMVMDPKKGIMPMVGFAVATTMIGAATMQMRELIKGNTPRETDSPKFWMAAAMQGGGFGLFGDFVFADYSRFGRTPIEDMMGPMFGTASDVLRLTMGNFDKAISDGDYDALNKFGTGAYDLITSKIPGQNLWYIRNYAEAFLDIVPKHFDPDYYDKRDRRLQYQQKNFGNDQYWTRGEWTPDLGELFQ